MADWKIIGGITALGGLIGYLGAKTVDSKKLPAGEKAVLTGASTGATMEGLDLALGAESFSADTIDYIPIYIEDNEIEVLGVHNQKSKAIASIMESIRKELIENNMMDSGETFEEFYEHGIEFDKNIDQWGDGYGGIWLIEEYSKTGDGSKSKIESLNRLHKKVFDNESFSALDYELNRNDCCELWVEKLYNSGKIGFGEAGNLLAAIEMDGLKCSQLGGAKCNKKADLANKNAESDDLKLRQRQAWTLTYHDKAENKHKYYMVVSYGDKYYGIFGRLAGYDRAMTIAVTKPMSINEVQNKINEKRFKKGYLIDEPPNVWNKMPTASQIKEKIEKKYPSSPSPKSEPKKQQSKPMNRYEKMARRKMGLEAEQSESVLKKLKQTYDMYESTNQHTSNYLLLATFFGTDAEKEKVKKIIAKKNRKGYLTQADNQWLYKNINPYYNNLRNVKNAETFEEKIDIDDFNKVADAIQAVGQPATVLFETKFGTPQIVVVLGDDIYDDENVEIVFDILDDLKIPFNSSSVVGDTTTLERKEYDRLRKINGGHKDFLAESFEAERGCYPCPDCGTNMYETTTQYGRFGSIGTHCSCYNCGSNYISKEMNAEDLTAYQWVMQELRDGGSLDTQAYDYLAMTFTPDELEAGAKDSMRRGNKQVASDFVKAINRQNFINEYQTEENR